MVYELIPAERLYQFADCSGGGSACWPWMGGVNKLRGGYGVGCGTSCGPRRASSSCSGW